MSNSLVTDRMIESKEVGKLVERCDLLENALLGSQNEKKQESDRANQLCSELKRCQRDMEETKTEINSMQVKVKNLQKENSEYSP